MQSTTDVPVQRDAACDPFERFWPAVAGLLFPNVAAAAQTVLRYVHEHGKKRIYPSDIVALTAEGDTDDAVSVLNALSVFCGRPVYHLSGSPEALVSVSEAFAHPERCDVAYVLPQPCPKAGDVSLMVDAVKRRTRRERIRTKSFASVSQALLDELASILQGRRTLDAGSGTGYLAHELTKRGAEVVAVDLNDYRMSPPGDARYPMSTVYQLDHHGDAVALLEQSASSFGAVLLVWPCINSPFAFNVAKAMVRGQVLVYCGESMGGCTGNDAFFQHLNDAFYVDLSATQALQQLYRPDECIHDSWHVFVKQ